MTINASTPKKSGKTILFEICNMVTTSKTKNTRINYHYIYTGLFAFYQLVEKESSRHYVKIIENFSKENMLSSNSQIGFLLKRANRHKLCYCQRDA